MNRAPVLKGSGLTPIDDEPVHVFGRNLESRIVEVRGDEDNNKQENEGRGEDDDKRSDDNKRKDDDDKREGASKQEEDDVETIKKRKFEAITGEENEETVFHGEFKLFVWDRSSSNWIEKGRGQLKLNDHLSEKRSRLIMRAGGTFRIILNVAIRHSLFKVISNTKTSIRFTDSQNVWAASGSNAKQLGDLLNDRIAEAAELAETDTKGLAETKEVTATTNEVAETKQVADTKEVVDAKEVVNTKEVADTEKAADTKELAGTEGVADTQAVADNKQVAATDEEKVAETTREVVDASKVSDTTEAPATEKEPDTVETPDSAKEVTKTIDRDEEIHHKGNDETKRLKLSSD
uniref:Ran-binding protein 3 n=1 Tax=Aceria tosichella TaxID=561515 RepID=A0A6G1S4X4_9ACAR